MSKQYKVYLDACCLNRPFDDQTQSRIYVESQAITTILSQCQSGIWKLINSSALIAELNQTPDLERRQNVKKLLVLAKIKVISSVFIEERAAQLQELGFSSYDAAHIASAERSQADVFLTTDDRLLKKYQKNYQLINVKLIILCNGWQKSYKWRKVMMRTQNEIIKQGYDALINSLGVADTIRFIQYFSPGKGDYTKERHQWLDEKTLPEILVEMKQLQEDDNYEYNEIIE